MWQKVAGMGHCRKKSTTVDTLTDENLISTCGYWAPLEDWRGETIYMKARHRE
jgi:hypothetical protein